MNHAQIKKQLVKWLKEQVRKSGCRGIVVGLSGGIDSAVTAALSQLACGRNCLGVIMPCHNHADDEKDARLLADHLKMKVTKVDLGPAYDRLIHALPAAGNKVVSGNMRPRLRMTVLYYYAGLNKYLVAGTGNKTEISLGYFTKYGDGGVDLLPLAGLLKSEVRALAAELGLPEELIKRKPSAGLWPGQTDEDEIGLPYDVLDCLVSGKKPAGKINPAKLRRINLMMKNSGHKRNPVPAFSPKKT